MTGGILRTQCKKPHLIDKINKQHVKSSGVFFGFSVKKKTNTKNQETLNSN